MPHTDLPQSVLEPLWMPFTANRTFKRAPRVLVAARGMYYTDADGRQILDGAAGLWCVNAGHGREEITAAIRDAAGRLDYAPAFQMGHPDSFVLAARLKDLLPGDVDHVFFGNSGSEAVDTALKVALAYWRARGEPERVRFVGRQRAYHGVGFGGISVGGIENNRKAFAAQLLPHVDHLPHTLDLTRNAFSHGLPAHGVELADALEGIVAQRGAATIAAVIVEPLAGATGVLPPPQGYLERLAAICRRHGILLIFDEVITGFGRLGTPFAAQHFGIVPDMVTFAKGVTNGAVPLSGAAVRREVYDAVVNATPAGIEFFHGYTYSGHPLAAATGIATLDVYRKEGLFERVGEIAPYWEEAVHSLRGMPHVVDVRNAGLLAGLEVAPRETPGARGFELFADCFRRGVLVRSAGDTICLSPPLIIEKPEIDRLVGTLADGLQALA